MPINERDYMREERERVEEETRARLEEINRRAKERAAEHVSISRPPAESPSPRRRRTRHEAPEATSKPEPHPPNKVLVAIFSTLIVAPPVLWLAMNPGFLIGLAVIVGVALCIWMVARH